MMKCAPLVTAVALLALFPGNALADWQFTRWGMTVDEVRDAANKKAVPLVKFPHLESDRKGNTARLWIEKHRVFGLDLAVTLFFRPADSVLAKLTLCTTDPSAFGDYERRLVFEELERALGKPTRFEHLRDFTVGIWADRTRNNIITAMLPLPDPTTMLTPTGCITYEPLIPQTAPSDF